jgi:hypothetical protein
MERDACSSQRMRQTTDVYFLLAPDEVQFRPVAHTIVQQLVPIVELLPTELQLPNRDMGLPLEDVLQLRDRGVVASLQLERDLAAPSTRVVVASCWQSHCHLEHGDVVLVTRSCSRRARHSAAVHVVVEPLLTRLARCLLHPTAKHIALVALLLLLGVAVAVVTA